MKRLTYLELKILKQLAKGYKAEDIGKITNYSKGTISSILCHLRQKIFKKPTTNTSLVLWYLNQIGLLDDSHKFVGKDEENKND